MMEFAARGATR